ncbi:uncharacterized mitochondrial protein AtMg00810-like [Aristolochia californica]|uniref:uncharacterized mitochondrial protein AtMg00810-like n=1 Tax=Aristolochia californica TaxID=171875 RepID=UPI0035DC8A7B
MTTHVGSLSNVRKYDGSLHINTADGSSMPISAVGDLSPFVSDVFVSPDLSTNLQSVGQLVDKNCNVQFSRSGCVVQDQALGKVTAKGPKVGCWFTWVYFLRAKSEVFGVFKKFLALLETQFSVRIKSDAGMVILMVYVDDIIITGTNTGLITKLQQVLHATFHMKDLGHLTYFLGLEVHHRPSGIFLNQHKYTQDLISLDGLEDTSSVSTPMEVNVKYRKDEGTLLEDPTIYRRLVGSLIYLTTTRPDISYVVHQVSQFMSSPRHLHLAAVRRIIRYLRGSPTRGLFFPMGSALRLVAYSDTDWAGCPDTC